MMMGTIGNPVGCGVGYPQQNLPEDETSFYSSWGCQVAVSGHGQVTRDTLW